MKHIEMLMAAARADADQQNAWLREAHPEQADEQDEGVQLLRDFAVQFDHADLKDERVRTGIGIAALWLKQLGMDFSCCETHGAYLVATARMLLSTLAREETEEAT